MFVERRRYYRLRYPEDVRPTPAVWIGGVGYALVELSECGLRFHADGPAPLEPGVRVEVRLNLEPGRSMTIRGASLNRTEGDEYIMVFDHGVPSHVVLGEQRRLIRRARILDDGGELDDLRPPRSREVERPS